MKTRIRFALRFIVGIIFMMWLAELYDAYREDGPMVDYVISIGGMIVCAALAAFSFSKSRTVDESESVREGDEKKQDRYRANE